MIPATCFMGPMDGYDLAFEGQLPLRWYWSEYASLAVVESFATPPEPMQVRHVYERTLQEVNGRRVYRYIGVE